jgi:hypothetical protein
MLEAVMIFGALSALFEAIVLWKTCPRWLIKHGAIVIHLFVIGVNLFIHYGTVTGTMTAIVAGLASFMVVPFMRKFI